MSFNRMVETADSSEVEGDQNMLTSVGGHVYIP